MCEPTWVNSALHDALVSHVQQHANSPLEKDVYSRFVCDDFCGVHYSVSLEKPEYNTEGTVAIRMTWPWQFTSSFRLAERLTELLEHGPPALTVSNASSRSAIVTWLLENKHEGITKDIAATINWLSSLRCANCNVPHPAAM